ncbi:extracellular triacylglycerol lipase precursor [Mycena albidolilacea]|uniref:Extracellular triacylglycerol lipase n=1 Tax=Mycena albidolilacea TaxID=1033008 RepID=A0AAD7ELK0_9AGAR|nr:extracellular triacylglycerol lipase precursor [Mycena albidolilacea]
MVLKNFLTSLLFFATAAKSVPTVRLGKTTVTGLRFSNLEYYGGIPYAEPPIDSLRFKPPVPLSNLNQATFDASKPGSPCLQPRRTEALPVMAFIHGGGYIFGSSSSLNATAIVEQSITRGTPIVYVSFNYRLGPLGFPNGHDALSANALNLGLKDQLLALQWIQDNIAAFNGDKSKVTLFGESAGAMSIGVLYLNSNLQNLVRAAIFESGSAGGTHVFDAFRGQTDWDNFVRAVPECANCKEDSIACLQQVNSSAALLEAIETSWAESNEGYPFAPVIDGPHGLLPDLPSVLMAKGEFARVPFISGANLDEGTYFTRPNVNSTAMIESFLISNYTTPTVSPTKLSDAVQQLVELYPDVPSLDSPFNMGNQTFGLSGEWKRLAALSTHLSTRRAWMQTAKKFGVKTFGYLLTDPGAPPISPPTVGPTAPDTLGVTHTADLLYVFGLNTVFGRPPLAVILGTQMIDYWLSFATSLDPNDGLGSSRPGWYEYTYNHKAILELTSVNMSMIPDNYRAQQIDFINRNAAVFAR